MANIIDERELNNQIEKIAMYKNEESVMLDSIKTNLNNYNYSYNTNNQKKLNDITLELSKKFNIIKNTHEKYITVINKTITNYEETSKKVENIISNIERY